MSGTRRRGQLLLAGLIGLAFGGCAPEPTPPAGGGPVASSKPARVSPSRISAIGDSLSVAFDSNDPLANPSESWTTGHFGFWQALLGKRDVRSHRQRLDDVFGLQHSESHAQVGGLMSDMLPQAQDAAALAPDYVTIGLGGNDVCRDEISRVTQPLDYAFMFLDGIVALDPSVVGQPGGLPGGASAFVVAVPDVKQLYDVGQYAEGLFGIDCTTIWSLLDGFPCGTFLSPDASDADRLAMQQINLEYNLILEYVVQAIDPISTSVHWDYTWAPWDHLFAVDEISPIDCFHPSSEGQRAFAAETWADGPFSAF